MSVTNKSMILQTQMGALIIKHTMPVKRRIDSQGSMVTK